MPRFPVLADLGAITGSHACITQNRRPMGPNKESFGCPVQHVDHTCPSWQRSADPKSRAEPSPCLAKPVFPAEASRGRSAAARMGK